MGLKYSWWKPEEIELIRTQLQAGIAIENIVITGRKTEYIRRKARVKGLIEKQRHPALTKAQKVNLRALRQEGYSVPQISMLDLLGLPHRTTNAIQKILGKIGLVNKNRSLAAKNRKFWCNGEKQEFDVFLRQHSKKFAAEQIAEKFGVTKTTVGNRQRFLGVKTSLAETLAIPYVRKKIAKVCQERSKKMLLDFERHIAEREKQLEALCEKIRRKKRLLPIEERRCKKCGGVWLKHKKFFFYATYRSTFGASWHFSRICAICSAKQRHQKMVERYQQKYSQQLE